MSKQSLFLASDMTESGPPSFRMPQCGRCGLFKKCKSPKMPVYGKGERKILVVGEYPGKDEDNSGRPFVGASGQELQDAVREAGFDLFRDCWVTNALRCRPGNTNTIEDDKAVDYCRPYLIQAIEELQPSCIILLGAIAAKSLLAHLWKDNVGPIALWAGWKIPCQKYNCWVCPTYHPSFVLRAKRNDPLPKRELFRHIKAAFGKGDRPWKKVPDYSKQLKIILSEEEAVEEIRAYSVKRISQFLAFDYETTTLKPNGFNAEIVSCSFSDGTRTIAFPWFHRVVPEVIKLLQDPDYAKIASNLKFEKLWTWKKLGIVVRNWGWDTMLAAHALDSRRGITSIKFQSFIRLGQEPYDKTVDDFLKADGGNEKNRIRELDISTLLKYNALDSLLEYKVAMQQMKEFPQ